MIRGGQDGHLTFFCVAGFLSGPLFVNVSVSADDRPLHTQKKENARA